VLSRPATSDWYFLKGYICFKDFKTLRLFGSQFFTISEKCYADQQPADLLIFTIPKKWLLATGMHNTSLHLLTGRVLRHTFLQVIKTGCHPPPICKTLFRVTESGGMLQSILPY